MGTTYSITLVTTEAPPPALEAHIKNRLTSLNRQMSTYVHDSEISRINNSRDNVCYSLSDDFATVMQQAVEVSKLTGGAFDPGLKPLIDLWGFGNQGDKQKIPSPEAIETLLDARQVPAFELKERRLHKFDPALELDLSAIAKGYAVDVLAGIVAQSGYHNYLVEIGGEVRARGHRPDGQAWKVAIQQPDHLNGDIHRVISLHNQSVATSGDYQNYFEVDGVRYAHVIDPFTGYPPDNHIASVTVITDQCMRADALATALMVMDLQTGLALADQLDLAVYYILRNAGGYQTRSSAAFKRLYSDNSLTH